MTGIEKLRKLAGDLCETVSVWFAVKIERIDDYGANPGGPTLECLLLSIADQIEREHAEEIASSHKLDDDARDVVERLRALPEGLHGYDLVEAVIGVDPLSTDTTVSQDYLIARDRLIELIERPIHDVDVAALLGVADRMDAERSNAINAAYNGRKYCKGIAYGIGNAPEIIRKAVEGAPKPGTEREAAAGEPNRLAHLNLAELAAAKWVEDHGGLEVVRDLAKMDEFVAHLAVELGVSDDVGCGDELRAAINVELDKRLMPCDLTWPRWDDGLPVTRDDAPEHTSVVALRLDGRAYGLTDAILNHAAGERVKRPEPEVLGADGLPIKVGETVYPLQGDGPLVVSGYYGEFLSLETGGLLRADYATHTPPDTQERIDEDVVDFANKCAEYTGQASSNDWFAVEVGEFLRRQRELDAKTGGDAR